MNSLIACVCYKFIINIAKNYKFSIIINKVKKK